MPAVIETVVMVGRNIGNQADFYLFASDVLCRQGSSHDAGHQKVWVKHDRTSENKKKSMNFSVISHLPASKMVRPLWLRLLFLFWRNHSSFGVVPHKCIQRYVHQSQGELTANLYAIGIHINHRWPLPCGSCRVSLLFRLSVPCFFFRKSKFYWTFCRPVMCKNLTIWVSLPIYSCWSDGNSTYVSMKRAYVCLRMHAQIVPLKLVNNSQKKTWE